MTAPSHLKSLQALELALRTGSLKGAAEQLGITAAAVGQRVKALEDYLGVDLVVRGRSGLKPAAALAGAMPHLASAFRELDAAAQALELQRAQELHVAALSDFAELWLKPRLGGFAQRHPNVRFSINGEGAARLRLGPADCEVTFGPARDDADLLFHDFVAPVTSLENAGRLATLPEKARIEGFPLLHLDLYRNDPAVPTWPQWVQRQGMAREAPERGIRFQRLEAVMEAVRADAGVVICGLALILRDLEPGQVVLPFGAGSGGWTSHGFQARFRPDTLARPQVRRFREWLLGEAAATASALAAAVR